MKTVYFNMLLANVIKAEGSIRDNVQTLVESAIATYGEHGDTSRIEALVNASVKMRSIRSNTLKEFIKAHANVKFEPLQNNDGFKVRKIGKGAMETQPIETLWYDFNNEGVAKEKELLSMLNGVVNQVDKAEEKGILKTPSVEESRLVATVRSQLDALTAA